MTRNKLISAIHKGAHNANRLYSKWSGGGWITGYGVEGFLVSEIAHAIQKVRENGLLTMEEPFEALLGCCGEKPLGKRTDAMTGARRVDIALWNSEEYVTHVVEVKREWNDQCYHDLDRIYDLQRKLKTVQCGLFIMLVVVEGDREALEEKVQKQAALIREYMGGCQHRIHYGRDVCTPQHEYGWSATSLCVEVFGRTE